MTGMETRIEGLEKDLELVEYRLDGVYEKLEKVNSRMENLEGSVETINDYLKELRAMMMKKELVVTKEKRLWNNPHFWHNLR